MSILSQSSEDQIFEGGSNFENERSEVDVNCDYMTDGYSHSETTNYDASDDTSSNLKKIAEATRDVYSLQLRPLLLHVPEMNLPWQPMRSTPQCGCGVAFTFSVRKV